MLQVRRDEWNNLEKNPYFSAEKYFVTPQENCFNKAPQLCFP